MNDWYIISEKHQDLKELVEVKKTKPKVKTTKSVNKYGIKISPLIESLTGVIPN